MGLIFVLSMLFLMVKAGTMQMSDNTCSTSCTENSKFAYMSGKTYTYMYESDITTQIVGASDDKASVHLTALVHLEILRKCEVSMKLNDVDFSEYGQDDSKMRRISNDFKIGLERNPTRFSYQDGKIEDICITDIEPIWVLNVKRGIISLIQNNMDDFSTSETVLETDVSGICNTMYSVLESYEDYFSIQKSKDLISCTDRHSFKSFIQGVPYTSKSYIKSLPLMKSDYNCISEIESGFLKSVQCEERNMLRPFSKSDSGAVTVNKQLLTFVRTSSGTQPQGNINIRRSLKFEHAHGIEKESNNRHDITSKLVEICENTRSGVDTDTPKLFEELVYIMKLADIDSLFAMNKFLTDDTLCKDNSFRTRKFFLDALPFIGTRASIHMITDLITSNAIHEHEADMWISSLSFIKKPTKEMLKEILPLVTDDINSEKVMLSIGTLIHNYCVHQGDCENDDFIKTVISAITVKITTGCRVDNNNRKPTLRLLKGLGNAGFADISTLTECMTLKSNPLDIRLSAIQATRRKPCRSNRMALITLLQDDSDSYETRIAAYKMLMACPTKNVIDAVKLTLAKESRNQISSYIWTHLSNLLRTSDIYKQDIGNILGDEALKRRFDLDNKKFARNYETSGFIEKLNTGSKIEADLIWSLRSSVPHSGMLNVTLDVFGQSVNIFEIGGRVEGLEKSIVEYLRSDRFFANTYPGMRLRDFLDDGKSFSGHPDDLRGSLYLRMFGNEILTMDIKEAETYLSGRDIISKIIKDDNFTFTQTMMFLDSKYMVPTSSGFTLSLTLRGTATVDFFKQSRRDVVNSDKFGISRRFRPSATVYIASMMSVDTFVTKSGIKLVSTLHTSTSLNGKIKTTKNGFFSLEYDMPDTVMKIFGINSSIYIVRTDSELEQTKIGKNKRNLSYCYKQVTVAGLELCAEVEYPLHSVTSATPYFPLTGPFGAGVYLYNRDTHVKYMIVAKSVISRGKRIINFTYNTPGSSINRQMKFYLFLNTNNGIIKTIISSPWKRIDFEGQFFVTNKGGTTSAKLIIDRKIPISLDIRFGERKHSKSQTVQAIMNFEAGNYPELNTKIVGELSETRSNLVYVQTNVDIWYGLDFQNDAKHIVLKLDMKKTSDYREPSASIRTSIKYPALDVDIHLKGEYAAKKNRKLHKHEALINFEAKNNPELNTKIVGELSETRSNQVDVQTNVDIWYGPDFQNNAKHIVFRMDMKKTSDYSEPSASILTSIKYPALDVDIQLKGECVNKINSKLQKLEAIINFEAKNNPELNTKIVGELSETRSNQVDVQTNVDIWYGPDFQNNAKHIVFRMDMKEKSDYREPSASILTSIKYPALDVDIHLKAEYAAKKYRKLHDVHTNVDIWHGPDFQNIAKHIVFRMDMKEMSDYSEPSASILTSIKYPALDVDIQLKGECVNKINSKLQKLEAIINFEAKNNPELNTKIVGELSETRSNQVDVQTNVDIWYGPDFQNNAKHIVFRMDMKEKSDYREPSASILTSIKYPALDVDIHLKAEYAAKKYRKLHDVHTNVDIWHGPDFQNIAKHIVFRMDMKKMSYYRKSSASILTSIKYPALDVDIHMSGDYVCENSKIWSSLVLHSGQRKPIKTSFRVGFTGKWLFKNINVAEYILIVPQLSIDEYFIYSAERTLVIPSTDTLTINIDIKLFGQSPANIKVQFKERKKFYSAQMSFESSHRKYESYMTLLLHDYLPPSEHLTGYIAVIFPTRIVIFDIFYVYSEGSNYESFKLDIVKKYDSTKNIFKTNSRVDITSKISTPLQELSRLAFDASLFMIPGTMVLDKFVFRFDPSRTYKLQPIVTTIKINAESGLKLSNEYNIGSDKKYFEFTAYDLRNVVTFNVLYKCQTLGLYSLTYEYEGYFKDFQCHEMSFKFMKNNEEWHGYFHLKTVANIQGMVKLESPSSRIKPILMSFEHTGDLNDFKCHVDLRQNNEEWHGDLNFKTDENIKGMLKIKPPSSHIFKPVLISFEHSWTKMISRTDVLIGEDKITYKLVCSLAPIFWHFDFQFGNIYMNTDFVLKIKRFSIGLTFRITSSLCSDATGDFYIQGEFTDFSSTTVLEISNNKNDEHLVYRTISSSIDSPTKIESAIEKLGLTVQRHGNIARLYTVKSGNKPKELTEKYSEINIDGKVSMNKVRSFKTAPLQDGSRSTLLQRTSKRYTVTFSFWSKENINFDGSITSPIEGYKSLSANFKQSSDIRYFKCTGNAAIEHEKSVFNIELDRYLQTLFAEASIKHNYFYSIIVYFKKDINTQISIVIPGMDNIRGIYTHRLSSHSCKTLAQLKLSSNVFFDCDVELNWKTDLNVVFTLKTPFQGLEKIVLKTNYDRSLNTMTTSANLQIEEYVVEVSTTIVDTPSFTNADLSLRTRGELMHSSARSHNDIRATFRQSGSSSGTVMTYEVNINSLTRINGELSTSQFGSGQMSANVELRTPFQNMEVNKVSYKHSRDSKNIKCDINSSIFGKEVTGTIAGSVQPLSMDLDIKTPFKDIENIALNGIVETDTNKYFGRMQAKLNPNNQFLIEGKLSTARSIDSAIFISSPFKQMRNASIMISDTNLVTLGVSEGVKVTHNGKRIG